jgi:5-methyltetrahydrofolate--homocysteine methyltransferase
VVLLEVASVSSALDQIRRLHEQGVATGIVPGVLLAGGPESVRGFADDVEETPRWVSRALDLEANGYRVIGGGAGTTEAHTAALARALGSLHPSVPAPSSGFGLR